jgi:SAM-dependent methyltransferase
MLARLRAVYDEAYQFRRLVGRMPPSPGTFRAKAGALLVRFVQRLLFWYTPQIHSFQVAAAESLHSLCELAQLQHQHSRAVSERLDRLNAQVSALRLEAFQEPRPVPISHLHGAVADQINRPESGLLPDTFSHAVMDRFRGSEAETKMKLRPYLEIIQSVPEADSAIAVDLGCGRGEWLALCRDAGRLAIGVDANAIAVALCRDKGLHVEHTDVVEYLTGLDSDSVGVITAFHVIEHWDFFRTFQVVQQAVRALHPGGLLIVETPHVNNLLAGTRDFWLDPTHRRPVPCPLMELLLDFCGLRILHRFELHPHPPESRLPFDELEFVHRLNEHFHGPEAYGLVAQKKTP